MTGYYMGSSPSLMTMMQTGGDAEIARAKQGVKEIKALESAQKKEAKRQGKGSLFGTLGGITGGLLLSSLLPAAAPAYLLALAAGGGTALGKGLGERLGAGRARRSEQPSDTFFYGKDFEDIDEASEEYNQGILERAGVSGLKAGLTAGLAPGGGMYGTVQGGLRNKLLDKGLLGYSSGITPGSMPASAGAEFAGDVTIPEFNTSLDDFSDLAEESAASSKAYSDTLEYLNTPEGRASYGEGALMPLDSDPTAGIKSVLTDYGVSIPQADPSDVARTAISGTEQFFQDTLPASNAIGQENAVLEALRSIQESKDSLARSATLQGNLEKYYQSLGTEAPAFVNREGGGLINYENGGPIMERSGGFGSGTYDSFPAFYDPTQSAGVGQYSFQTGTGTQADTAGYNTNVQDIATSMGLRIDDDASKYYEGFDYGEVNPLIRNTRGDLGQEKISATALSAEQGFSESGAQQQSLLDLTQASSDIVSEARERSAEDYQEGIKERLATDIGAEVSGITELTPEEQLAATPVPTNDPNWNPPANAMPNTDYSFGDQIWQFRRQVGPGGAQGEGRWIRIS